MTNVIVLCVLQTRNCSAVATGIALSAMTTLIVNDAGIAATTERAVFAVDVVETAATAVAGSGAEDAAVVEETTARQIKNRSTTSLIATTTAARSETNLGEVGEERVAVKVAVEAKVVVAKAVVVAAAEVAEVP